MARIPLSIRIAAGLTAAAAVLLALLAPFDEGVSPATDARQADFDAGGARLVLGGGNPNDQDGDGVEDFDDNCPTVPNPGQEDEDGDNDGDGIGDACEDQDGDGIYDPVDLCPSTPEDFDGIEDEDGCPETDADDDGVLDVDDPCPTDAEDTDGVFDGDGCPEPANVDQTSGLACPASSVLNTNEPLGQTFTPADSSLMAVDVVLARGNSGASATITMRVREGSISGTVLASSTKFIGGYGATEKKVERFGMAPVLGITAGNTYVIELDSNNDAHAWCRATSSTYAGGCAVAAGVAQCSYDMSFQTLEAVPLVVTRTDDPVPDGCAIGDCSVREAVMASVNNPDAQVINIPAGTYTLTRMGTGEEGGFTGDLDLHDIAPSVTINGLGATFADTIIEGCSGTGCTPVDRVFDIEGTGLVVINKLKIRNGNPGSGSSGGGINVSSGAQTPSLILNDSEVSGSTANFGAGIHNTGFSVTINNTRVVANNAPSGQDVGGIYNGAGGVMTVNDSIVSNNTARQGGGIRNDGTMVVNRTGVFGNTSEEDGGGIRNLGTLTINESAVNNNDAHRNGGGIANSNGGTVNINNSTVSGNRADYLTTPDAAQGGGIFNDFNFAPTPSTINLSNATVASNTSTGIGGGIKTQFCCFSPPESNYVLTNVKNSIIADNIADTGVDCSGTQTSQGYNLIQDATGCTIVGNTIGNLTGVNAHLLPQAPNGGATETHALCEREDVPLTLCEDTSPAIEAGNPTGCTNHAGTPFTTDQRGAGFPRAVDGDGDRTDRCDMGAYEAPEPPDSDGDGLGDPSDDCPTGETGWTSDATTDHDDDGCRDAGEDPDDDNDGVLDGTDACPAGDTGWTAGAGTDNDGDGCRDAGEDTDDDNDGASDAAETAAGSDPLNAASTPEICDGVDNDLNEGVDEGFPNTDGDGMANCVDTDDDNDGVFDTVEESAGSDPLNAASTPEACDGVDNDLNEGIDEGFPNTDGDGMANCVDPDDDNDGVLDGSDSCPIGATVGTDTDGDGCKNAGEDADDDNDGVLDGADACPIGATGGTDTDGDGCKNAGEDADDDNDRIDDVIDEAALVVSDRFSDKPAGKTAGRITLIPGGMTVAVQEAPNPKGVRFIVTGAGQARVRLDGKSGTWRLAAGTYVLTDPDAETTTETEVNGPAEIEMDVDGMVHLVVVEAGESAKVIEGVDTNGDLAGFTVEALDGDVTVNGNTVSEGNSSITGEVCDGVDNDSNEGTDEGYTNTDADATADCVDVDDDNDGFDDADEAMIGTDSLDRCGSNGWPVDLIGAEQSENRITLQDLASFFLPDDHFNTFPEDSGFDARWDIVPGPALPNQEWIGLQDLGAFFAGSAATPPMFSGAQIFNGPACTELP
jgi:hypothetical protein